MKLSFSTNGWKALSWPQAYRTAKDFGFAGIEIHDILDARYSGQEAPFSPSAIASTARLIADSGIEIPCIDAVSDIACEQAADAAKAEVLACIDMAKTLRCPYVRIHADTDAQGKWPNAADERAAAFISEVLDAARKARVALLVETAGIYGDTARLVALLNRFACDELGALWDLHHPYRFFGEDPETTITNLGAFIQHVHIKDSLPIKRDDGSVDAEYCLMGEGDLPVEDMLYALDSVTYSGYVSLECFPTWLEELGSESIVFPHFISFMSRFAGEQKTPLYDNKAKTGKYVWKKEELINLTFSRVLDRMVEEFPDQVAFKYTTLDYTRTYAEFRDDVDTFARALIALGVKQGDHVAVWATNLPQWFIAFWATTKIGAVLVTVNTAYKIHEAEYLLRQSDTHTLIMCQGYRDSDYASIMAQLCPELESAVPGEPLHCRRLPFLRNIITIGYRQKGCLTWDEAVEFSVKVPVEEVFRRAAATKVHDVVNMQYTSGTTGFPKGVMLTHYNIVNNGKCIGDRMDLSTADRLMIQVPMFHCFGMVLAMTAAMTHGTTMCPLPYFSPKPALACINQEAITAFHGVPTMFIAMLEHEDFEKTDFSHMRTGIMAGSPCPISVMRDVLSKMNMSEITIVYGQTEASPGCTMSRADDPIEVRVGTVGCALPQIECKVVDPETNQEVPVGVTGEFVARGYNIMKGYYKMPRATRAAIDAEGWLHTGDLATMTEEGNFRITGRLKDMIIRGGENIYPKEIEEFIYTHPKVKDVQVIGVPDERYGEEIMACVILKDGEEMSEQEMQAFVLASMAKHKVPKYVDFVESFPMNAAGKILKHKMRSDAVVKLGLNKAASVETA